MQIKTLQILLSLKRQTRFQDTNHCINPLWNLDADPLAEHHHEDSLFVVIKGATLFVNGYRAALFLHTKSTLTCH